jgi:transketolase
MALGLRMDGSSACVYTILGDGELAEGSNWEAAAAAAHHKADNLVAFADCNGLQISGPTKEVMNMTPVADHFAAFGWAVTEIDGNNMREILSTLSTIPLTAGKPSLIVAHTVKAKGISFAENNVKYHYWKPGAEELEKAKLEMDKRIEELKEKKEEVRA